MYAMHVCMREAMDVVFTSCGSPVSVSNQSNIIWYDSKSTSFDRVQCQRCDSITLTLYVKHVYARLFDNGIENPDYMR